MLITCHNENEMPQWKWNVATTTRQAYKYTWILHGDWDWGGGIYIQN